MEIKSGVVFLMWGVFSIDSMVLDILEEFCFVVEGCG